MSSGETGLSSAPVHLTLPSMFHPEREYMRSMPLVISRISSQNQQEADAFIESGAPAA